MPYTITPAENGEYIIIKFGGEWNRDLGNQAMIEATALASKLGIRCHLTDVTESRNTEAMLQNYRFARTDMQEKQSVDQSACVALLVSPEDHSHDFYETLARDAGADVTLFRDREQALAHLAAAAKRLHLRRQDE